MPTIENMPVNWATKDDSKEQWEARRDALKECVARAGVHGDYERILRYVVRVLATYHKTGAGQDARPPAYDAEKASVAADPGASERKRYALRMMRVDQYNMAWKIYLQSIKL